jgi:hypothetical protein
LIVITLLNILVRRKIFAWGNSEFGALGIEYADKF